MQTSFQAIDALLRGRQPEYVPLFDSPWGDTLTKWVGQGYPTNDDGKPVSPDEHFGFDMAGSGGWFHWMATRNDETLEETDDWRIVRNGNGAALKWWKKRSGTPEHIDFRMSSREIWERDYKPHLLDADPADRVNLDHARELLPKRREQGVFAFYGHQFIWECLRASLGDVNMFMALVEDPGWIHDFCRTHLDLWIRCYSYLFEQVGLPDGVWVYEDLGYRGRLFCNPAILEQLIFPYYRELVAFFHSHDLPVVFHSCGFQAPMIPLAIDAGFDALNPMEVKAGNDIMAYAEQYGDKLAFVGGFDATILESGDRPRIEDAVGRHMEGLKERGARFVFGSDHSLSTNIDYGDFQFCLDVYRRHRML